MLKNFQKIIDEEVFSNDLFFEKKFAFTLNKKDIFTSKLVRKDFNNDKLKLFVEKININKPGEYIIFFRKDEYVFVITAKQTSGNRFEIYIKNTFKSSKIPHLQSSIQKRLIID